MRVLMMCLLAAAPALAGAPADHNLVVVKSSNAAAYAPARPEEGKQSRSLAAGQYSGGGQESEAASGSPSIERTGRRYECVVRNASAKTVAAVEWRYELATRSAAPSWSSITGPVRTEKKIAPGATAKLSTVAASNPETLLVIPPYATTPTRYDVSKGRVVVTRVEYADGTADVAKENP